MKREVSVTGLYNEGVVAHVCMEDEGTRENMTATYARTLGHLLIAAADEADDVNAARRANLLGSSSMGTEVSD